MAGVVDHVPEIMKTIKCIVKGLAESQKSTYPKLVDISASSSKDSNRVIQYIMSGLNLACPAMPAPLEENCSLTKLSVDDEAKLSRNPEVLEARSSLLGAAAAAAAAVRTGSAELITAAKERLTKSVESYESRVRAALALGAAAVLGAGIYYFAARGAAPSEAEQILALAGAPADPFSFSGGMSLDREDQQKNAFSCLINAILQKSFSEMDLVLHKGHQVVRLPDSKELKLRLASPLWANWLSAFNTKTSTDISDNVFWAMVGKHYSQITESKRDIYLTALDLDSSVSDKIFEMWDEQVEKIKDQLIKVAGSGKYVVRRENRIEPPQFSPNSVSEEYKDSKDIFMDREKMKGLKLAGFIRRPLPLSVAVRREPPLGFAGFKGGNVNPHAPLYPTLVMNGGAHPFATLSGGVNPTYTAKLVNGINVDNLIKNFERVAGVTTSGNPIVSKVKNYRTGLEDAARKLQKDMDILQNATLSMAQYPLGAGYNPDNFSRDQLKKVAERGEEINKAAQRLYRRSNRFDEIVDYLQEIVNHHTPAVNL